MTRPMLKFFVHDGFMQHAECTRATLVLYFRLQVRFWRDFEHFGGKIHENFSDVALAHRNEDGQTGYKRVTYPFKRVLSMV